jgi:hypothetical protein
LPDEVRRRARAIANAHIERLEIEVDEAFAGGDPDVGVGVFFEKSTEARHEPARGERRNDADGDEGALARLWAAQARRHFAQSMEDAMQLGRPSLPFRGEHETARGAAKKLGTEIRFERLDLVADGGLRHAELGAGPGEASVARGRLEDVKRVQRRQRDLPQTREALGDARRLLHPRRGATPSTSVDPCAIGSRHPMHEKTSCIMEKNRSRGRAARCTNYP